MRFGLSVPNFAEPGRLVELARAAEASGWDGFFLWDHIVVDLGSPPPISEPWTVLAAIATATSRATIGTLVTPVARRRPWVLARQVTTVDHLSGGRAVLGAGLGVPPETEYAALGEPEDPRRRAALVDEGLDVLAALWSGEPVHHDGPHHHLDGVRFLPVPVQRPRPPIWVAASLPARGGVRRAARWDGIAPIVGNGHEVRPVTPEELATVIAEVGERRDISQPFDVVVWVLVEDEAGLREYEDAGATWIIHGPAPGPDWLDDATGMARDGPPA
jgi:alkanesulfonate monooxygenase SsuD/methylene tetrahydromethanopterin reductase-like flavin-dependent oxidoreductase (luciferase family)